MKIVFLYIVVIMKIKIQNFSYIHNFLDLEVKFYYVSFMLFKKLWAILSKIEGMTLIFPIYILTSQQRDQKDTSKDQRPSMAPKAPLVGAEDPHLGLKGPSSSLQETDIKRI